MPENVVLRAFHSSEFELLYARQREWLRDEVDANPEHWEVITQQRIERSGDWGADDIDFAIELDGRLVGGVQALHDFYKLPPRAYELGIELYDDADRGRGLGRKTLSLFVPGVFAAGAIRLQGRTHVENTMMIRLFERCGFVHEGVLRELWPLEDRSGDMAMYAMTRADFAASELMARP
jgi:RimJ/RimL family protein N-acetyltransferase